VLREALWRQAACGPSRDLPLPDLAFRARTTGLAAHRPAQAIREGEGDRIAEPAVAVALQRHPLTAREHRQFLEIEDHQLAVVAHDGDVIVRLGDLAHDAQLRAGLEIDDLPPLAR